MRPPHRERGLADLRGARDGADHHRHWPVRPVQQCVQPRQRVVAAGEVGDAGRQHGGHRRPLRAGLRPHPQGRVVAQDGQFQVAQLRSGVDAEFVREQRPGRAELGQRLVLLTAPVEREQPLAGQPLAAGLFVDRDRELVEQFGGLAKAQQRVEAVFPGQAAGLGKARAEPVRDVAGRDVGQCGPPPQRQCLVQQRDPCVVGHGDPGLADQPLEPVHVDPVRIHPQQVTRPLGDHGQCVHVDPGPGQRRAQVRNVDADRLRRAARWFVRPDPFDQPVDGDQPVRLPGKHGEHQALLTWSQPHRRLARLGDDGGAERSQQPQLDPHRTRRLHSVRAFPSTGTADRKPDTGPRPVHSVERRRYAAPPLLS